MKFLLVLRIGICHVLVARDHGEIEEQAPSFVVRDHGDVEQQESSFAKLEGKVIDTMGNVIALREHGEEVEEQKPSFAELEGSVVDAMGNVERADAILMRREHAEVREVDEQTERANSSLVREDAEVYKSKGIVQQGDGVAPAYVDEEEIPGVEPMLNPAWKSVDDKVERGDRCVFAVALSSGDYCLARANLPAPQEPDKTELVLDVQPCDLDTPVLPDNVVFHMEPYLQDGKPSSNEFALCDPDGACVDDQQLGLGEDKYDGSSIGIRYILGTKEKKYPFQRLYPEGSDTANAITRGSLSGVLVYLSWKEEILGLFPPLDGSGADAELREGYEGWVSTEKTANQQDYRQRLDQAAVGVDGRVVLNAVPVEAADGMVVADAVPVEAADGMVLVHAVPLPASPPPAGFGRNQIATKLIFQHYFL